MSPEPERILIVGATSAIAQALARRLAREQAWLFLVARDPQKLSAVAQDLQVRGAGRVETFPLEATDYPRHPRLLEALFQGFARLDGVLVAHGELPDQKKCEQDVAETLRQFEVNALSVLALLVPLANYFEKEKRGWIAVISSVAGERGRQSNYVYGAAKAAVTRFLEGLRNRLWKSGVTVLTVKPGFVDTPMTAHLPKNFLFASPEQVARGIHRALKARKDVVYVPWYWRWIMAQVRLLPEALFKRLKL